MPIGLFTESVRDRHPLSLRLETSLQPLADEINRLGTTLAVDEFIRERLDGYLHDCVIVPPALRGTRAARVDGPEWRSAEGSGIRVEYTRRWTAIEVTGDVTLLECWPDKTLASEYLTPVDSDDAPKGPLQFEDPTNFWQVGLFEERGRQGTPMALYSYVDLTVAEEEAVLAGTLNLVKLLQDRRAYIEPIVEAIAEQTKLHFAGVPDRVRDFLSQKRTVLARRESVTQSLSFADEWKLDVPQLESLAGNDRADPVLEVAEEVGIPSTQRLSPKSFTALQRTIRVWADAVERHPDAFRVLIEDRISDLLAATLQATLPGADREVYSRSGKTDILVRADVLNEGRGPANVFIAETKWARTSKVVKEAVDPQLFSYLTSHDTAAILLLLLDQQDGQKATEKYFDDLRQLDAFREERTSSVVGWPLMVFETNGVIAQVCIATIHLPPTSRSARESRQIIGKR